jgi:hypothetical protein
MNHARNTRRLIRLEAAGQGQTRYVVADPDHTEAQRAAWLTDLRQREGWPPAVQAIVIVTGVPRRHGLVSGGVTR